MNVRDRARSDLYLAQLRSQSAPNTPGFSKTPLSQSFGAHLHDDIDVAEKGEYFTEEDAQYARKHQSFSTPKPFALQPPPVRITGATPTLEQTGFASPRGASVQEHVPAAPGEQTYDAVPIPGAYASPLSSPSFAPASLHYGRAGSPPLSPGFKNIKQH